MNRESGRRSLRLVALLTLPVLAVAGCGSLRSHEDVVAAYQQTPVEQGSSRQPGQASSDVLAPTAPGGSDPALPVATGAGPAVPAASTGSKASSPSRVGSPAPGAPAPAPGASVKDRKAAAPAPGAPGTGICTGPKAPAVIGTVGTQSGVVGAALIGGVKAVQAWVAGINASGGIDCHPVKYVVADDGGDPARHLALVRQLVERDGVISFVYLDAVLSGQASVEYLNEKQVPVIGQEGGQLFFYDSPMHFPQMSVGEPMMDLTVLAGARATIPEGKTKAAIITCQEATYCNVADRRFADLATKVGYEVVFKGKASLTQPDFTAQCLAAKGAGAQVIIGAFDSASWKRMADSCARVSYKPTIVLVHLHATLDMAKNPNFEGLVVALTNAPWFADSIPGVAEFQSVLKRFTPGLAIDAGALVGWTAAKLFEKAARGHLSDQPTSADVLAGLWSIKGDTLGGLTSPLTFKKGANATPTTCGWVARIKAGAFVSDGKRFCE